MHPKYTTTYRVGNWAEYDRALVRRGDVTLWLTPDAIATWAVPTENLVPPLCTLGIIEDLASAC